MGLCASSSSILRGFAVQSPRTIVSLLDMLRFFAGTFVSAVHNLELVRNMLLTAELEDGRLPINWLQVDVSLGDIEKGLKHLPVSLSLHEQVRRTIAHAKKQDPNNVHHLIAVIGEISHNIVSELTTHLFLCVNSELKWHYLTPEAVVGEAFEATFPDAVKDAHSGIRCFVLDEWTASVFHFMRVLEHGIRSMCTTVEISIENIQLENWKNILDQVEKKIRDMEQLARSQEKIEKIKFLSEAAANFRYFKDAWRNHVSHSRATYDSKDAKRVMDHVIDFMQQLAKPIYGAI